MKKILFLLVIIVLRNINASASAEPIQSANSAQEVLDDGMSDFCFEPDGAVQGEPPIHGRWEDFFGPLEVGEIKEHEFMCDDMKTIQEQGMPDMPAVQPGQEEKKSPASQKTEDAPTIEDMAAKIYTCKQCGESFLSGKALKIHLQNHLISNLDTKQTQTPNAHHVCPRYTEHREKKPCDLCGRLITGPWRMMQHRKYCHEGQRQSFHEPIIDGSNQEMQLLVPMPALLPQFPQQDVLTAAVTPSQQLPIIESGSPVLAESLHQEQPEPTYDDKDIVKIDKSAAIPSLRIYTCTYCWKIFRHPRDRDKHLLVHTGRKSEICVEPGCEFTCSRADMLKRHKCVVHGYPNGEANLRCPVAGCGFYCGRMFSLARHVNSKHPNYKKPHQPLYKLV